MRISPDLLAAHLAGETVVLDLASKQYYRLNESAAIVYRIIEKDGTRDEAIARLLATFDVSDQDARTAVDEVMADFASRRFVK